MADRAAFQARFLESAASAAEMACVHLGHSLGYYRALDKPRTAAQLARATGTDARYAREWLEQQAKAGYLECDDKSAPAHRRKYRLDPELAPVLADGDSTDYLVPLASLCVAAQAPIVDVEQAYRSGAGVPYRKYGAAFVAGQAAQNRALFLDLLGKDWIPRLKDVHARLRKAPPARVADVGCGAAWSSIALAQAYPQALVDGFDLDARSVKAARANVAAAGLEGRVSVAVRDAADVEHKGRYDLVMAYECIHDLSDPVGVLRSMRSMCKPGGTVLVMDENTGASLAEPGPFDRIFYAWSVLHCLPVGRDAPKSAATGTVMRTETLQAYAKKAGFSKAEVAPIPNDFFRFYRLTP
jgi:2-polyprenyl-3-methyl-5-hydroxy-6-metoxy-1,4-benzoquinol methylase